MCVFQLCGRGEGRRSALSLFPLLSLSGASQTQQQSMTHLSAQPLFTLCFVLSWLVMTSVCFFFVHYCFQFREMIPSDNKHAKVNDMVFHSYK